MTTRKQIVGSLALVFGAAAVVAAVTLWAGEPDRTAAAMEGHDHAAMQAGAGDAGPSPVTLDAEQARRIGVSYATAVLEPLQRSVRTVGTVAWDETRLVNVNPKVEGWVERLHVDFTGAPVRRGQPLLEVYSPMLVAAQEELILARRLLESAGDGEGRASESARQLLESARRRLSYWDVSAQEIARIEAAGVPSRTITIRAPASGLVVEKAVALGSRIMPGMDLYRIADLSKVWVEGEVYEKDLSLVHAGQHAMVSFDAYPGETLHGRVTYIHPTVSPDTRTGRVRVELDNPGHRLKPGMYASLTLEAAAERPALLIPRDAVHFTGQRALVFIAGDDGVLRPREITTGLVAGTRIEVLAGLAEGDRVVSSANFLIDAESNMGSSMNSMPGMDMGAPAESPAAPSAPAPASGHEGH